MLVHHQLWINNLRIVTLSVACWAFRLRSRQATSKRIRYVCFPLPARILSFRQAWLYMIYFILFCSFLCLSTTEWKRYEVPLERGARWSDGKPKKIHFSVGIFTSFHFVKPVSKLHHPTFGGTSSNRRFLHSFFGKETKNSTNHVPKNILNILKSSLILFTSIL